MNLLYKEIIGKKDRSFTPKLLKLLVSKNISEEEIDNIAQALDVLEDPRSWNVLKQIVLDNSNSDLLREKSINILSGSLYSMEREEVLFLWSSNDLLVKKLALNFMDKNDEELILSVINDENHDLNMEAIEVFFNSFQLREGNKKIAFKLSNHQNPYIRELVADFFYWEETADGLYFLIEATYDSNIDVVLRAYDALSYYPSIVSLKRLLEIELSNDIDVSESRTEGAQWIRQQILSALKDKNIIIANHIKNWVKPIWELLSYSEEELSEDEEIIKSEYKKNVLPDVNKKDIYKYLTNPDTSLLEIHNIFNHYNWNSLPEKDSKDIIKIVKKHLDPIIRSHICPKLASWNDQETLIELAYDNELSVQKSAMYYLAETIPVSNEISKLAWERLQDRNVIGSYQTETLSTYINHTLNRNEVFQNLFNIANDSKNTEIIRNFSIQRLIEFKCVDKLERLMWIINEPPVNSWALHNSLLEAVNQFNIKVDVHHLLEVDDLYIQKNIAPLYK